jgi:putative membrane protein
MAQLDQAASARIEAAIAEVERTTSSEIVVAEAPASDDYTDLALGYGITLALTAAAVAHLIAPALAVAWLIALEAAVVVACFAAFRASAVVRMLAPEQRLREAVERRAREAFFEHGLFATRERTGVLILISALEHRVVILGDRGIDQHLHAAGWQVHVHHITRAIREGRAGEGICEVIRAIGTVLAEHLPPRADDTDELANQVRRH